MSDEEIIDVEVNLGKELADKFNKMTKRKLLNCLVVAILKSQVQSETINELEAKNSNLTQQSKRLKTSLSQARNVIGSIMNGWG